MKKVILLQGSLLKYRDPIYSYLNKEYDLTLGYMHENKLDDLYNIYKVPYKRLGSIFLPTKSFMNYVKKYEIIIIMPDLHYFNYCLIPFYFSKTQIISWSIGMRASYTLKYNVNRKKTLLDYILLYVYRNCDANIFYYNYPKLFWGGLLNLNNVFIATNTTSVYKSNRKKNYHSNKKYILFVGSLIKGKGIFNLLKSFKNIINKHSDFNLKMIIVGEGPLKNEINSFIKNNKLEDLINIKGAIYEEEILSSYFKKAICMISPNQAGLSVLKSMGYGVPVVTKFDSITGGERFNINDENGFIYKEDFELEKIISQSFLNPKIFLQKGKNSLNYYQNNTTINHMINGFKDAFDYLKHKQNG